MGLTTDLEYGFHLKEETLKKCQVFFLPAPEPGPVSSLSWCVHLTPLSCSEGQFLVVVAFMLSKNSFSPENCSWHPCVCRPPVTCGSTYFRAPTAHLALVTNRFLV